MIAAPYLTKRQEEVSRCMAEWQLAHRLPPTLREVGECLGLSKVTVLEHVRNLLEKDQVEQGDRYAQRRYRVRASVLRCFASSDTLSLLATWRAANDKTRAEFANFVLSWWAKQEGVQQ